MAGGGALLEREVKVRVAEAFVLPELDHDGIEVADMGERELRAVYWDSPDLQLVHAHVGLRWRDGVWTFKGVSSSEGDAVVREEVEVEGPAAAPPAALLQRVASFVDVAALRPVAELVTRRRTLLLTSGAATAELVHDHVTVLDGRMVRGRFSEVEVEYRDGGSIPLVERVVEVLVRHGAVVDPTPKLLRALRALGRLTEGSP